MEHISSTSKAAARVASRRLATFGLIRRVGIRGDRKKYYRTADHLGTALKEGVMAIMRRRLETAWAEIDDLIGRIERVNGELDEVDGRFLLERLRYAKGLSQRFADALNSQWLELIAS